MTFSSPEIALIATTAAVFAFTDWVAVWRDATRVRLVTKPGTMILLTGVAVLLVPADPTTRALFVLALVLSLAGDVFLLLDDRWFRAGLVAFLLAHIAYIVGFGISISSLAGAVAGAAIVAAGLLLLGHRILRSIKTRNPELHAPVAVYMAVISTMVITAGATGSTVAAAGAVLFYISDSILAWGRFVHATRIGSVAVMVTYHTAQAVLIASLV